MFYPPAIRVHTSAQSPSSTITTTKPSPAENPPSKSNTTTPSTSIVVAETPSLEKNPTLVEATPLASQPTIEGQVLEDVEKQKTPEDLGTQ